MYTVIGTRKTRTFRVLWMLEEIGQPYEHVPCAPHSPEALAANSSGKIPVLVIEGKTITDSVAILTYLGDAHEVLTFPAGTVDRAWQDALSHQILGEIDAVLWSAARHSFLLPEERRVPAIKETLRWEYGRNLSGLTEALRGPFLMGEKMTIPDILLSHCLRWAEIAGFPQPDAKMVEYLRRMEARPAFQRVVEMP